MPYLVDTDALVHIADRADATRIYAAMTGHCRTSNILTVHQVFDELKRFPHVRTKFWPHKAAMKVDQYCDEVMEFVGYISDNFEFLYDLSGAKNPDPADPWLIACSKVFGYTLVTDERPLSTKKIPYVCRQQSVQVRVINGPDLLQELGI